MALRKRFPDSAATYADPVRGINLLDSEEDLKPGEARLMQNCIYLGGIRKRFGSQRLTPASLGAFRIRGGTKFYRADGTSVRYVAYSNRISAVSDSGAETVLTTGMTADQDTHFTTWSIADACYVANGVDTLRRIDNTGGFSTVTGTNIPAPRMVVPFRDRLLAITDDGIERTNPRVDTVWSKNSGWATLRPDRVGRFTAIAPFTLEAGTATQPVITAVIAFQPNAYYLVTGTNLGADVTSSVPSPGEDSSIIRLNAEVGTSSPYSVTNVPGLGLFWFTTDRNVYWLPPNSSAGRFIGDRLRSSGSTRGIESVNPNALSQVVMVYFDRFLILAVPLGSDVYPSTQFWLDTRALIERPQAGPVWYGPMVGQTVGRMWVENQGGDHALLGAEGNATTGAFVYRLFQEGVFSDAVGLTDTPVTMIYQTYFKSFGLIEYEKYLRNVQVDANLFSGTATLDVLDLGGAFSTGTPLSPL